LRSMKNLHRAQLRSEEGKRTAGETELLMMRRRRATDG
jgi:hypothetical protein